MEKLLLNKNWQLRIAGDSEYMEATIPGSVYSNFMEKERMDDPFYRDNELTALKLMENDFEFRTSFTLSKAQLQSDALFLCFHGIDTLADVYVNGELAGSCDNMHRVWEFDIAKLAQVGENELYVKLFSPTKYIEEENNKIYTGGSHECMKGFPHLRKAHCMFGWDWGPRLPDAGIFRDVVIECIQEARIDQVAIIQKWEENVTLQMDVSIESFVQDDNTVLNILVKDPEGKIISETCSAQEGWDQILIENPQKWWPRGYGEQPLYEVEVVLRNDKGDVLDVASKRIGLRTMTMNMDADEWGECFAHEVNGVKIFAMGADYIPEDNILSRVTPERTRRLLEDAVAANHNCIRVWGGGYYPDDWFYDICDELGLMVWQDFMFSCASYELDSAFEKNIIAEIRDNVRRIRHHACLGVWCGNNEMETQTLDGAWQPSQKQKMDYIKLFEYIIPKILEEEDPVTFYWPSSPSSGGNYDNPWDENKGDTHYWDVWHGNKPFTEYRKFFFRYLSEFGFQSFPCLKTVETFTLPEDRNIFSRVMEMHQRNAAANGKILNYLSATYLYPGKFDTLLYASQLLQADAIRYGIEHFRRNRGRCMGTVVWQLNDIWPVASWASIDYYGRWKALHYAEKRAFAPIMISCEEIGELSERPFCIEQPREIEKSARLHVANETMQMVSGTISWQLRDPRGTILEHGEKNVCVDALSGVWLDKLDFTNQDERTVYLSFGFEVNGEVVSEGTCLFTAPKHFCFENPELAYRVDGKKLIIASNCYAQKVEIEGIDGDARFSDNYFDMNPGEKSIEILTGDATMFRLRSVYDIR